jgi:hypothetical protein
MKKLSPKLVLLFICVIVLSCTADEKLVNNEPLPNSNVETKQPFFNLNVGSKWVYKKYETNHLNPNESVFSGIVDTVKIVSIENIQGFKFAKKLSKKVNINYGNVISEKYSYLRVNNLGHLVQISYVDENSPALTETSGLVLHPGFDKNFTYNQEYLPYFSYETNTYELTGNILYSVFDSLNIDVEGKNYLVSPFNGVFTPSANRPELVSKTIENDYAQGIGLVKLVCHWLQSNSFYEERLVWYDLK